MRVHFRTYCYGCRQGRRWNTIYREGGQGRTCIWRQDRYEWDYFIEEGGRRLVQRSGFASFDRAWQSAERSWFKLQSALRGAA